MNGVCLEVFPLGAHTMTHASSLALCCSREGYSGSIWNDVAGVHFPLVRDGGWRLGGGWMGGRWWMRGGRRRVMVAVCQC